MTAEVSRDHAAALRQLNRLEKAVVRLPLGERKARLAARQLVAIESRHETAEAEVLWPVVRDRLPDCADSRAEAVGQEREARHLLLELSRTAGRPESAELVARLARAIRAHVDLEESQVLWRLDRHLSDDEAARLGREFAQARAKAPTRPHPHVPDIPGLLRLTAPLARRVDRVRDLLRLP